MKTEFLKGFNLSDEDIQKILAEHGKGIEREKAKTEVALKDVESLKAEKQTMAEKIEELSTNETSAEEYKKQLEELQAKIKEEKEKAKLEAEDKKLTDAIAEVISDREFTSEYAKQGVIRDMKVLVNKPENRSKSYADIFKELVENKEGIFVSPNQVQMGDFGNIDTDISTDQLRAAMGLDPEAANK